MAEPNGANPHSLTGVWHGIYSYPHDQPPVSFVATLIEHGGTVSGTTHEPCPAWVGPNEILCATLAGSRRDRAVDFVKAYNPASIPFDSPIVYEGTLNGDGTEIEGRWIIPGVLAGKFLMVRSAGAAETIARKIAERV
jgi:hypothetical protein